MSNKVIMNRGKEGIVNKQAINSGSVWFTNEGNLYVDLSDEERVKISDILIFDNEDDLNAHNENQNIKNKLIILLKNGKSKLLVGVSNSKTVTILDSATRNPFYISHKQFIAYTKSQGLIEYHINKDELYTPAGFTVHLPELNSLVFDSKGKIGIIKDITETDLICYIINNVTNESLESYHLEAVYYADKDTRLGDGENGSLYYPYTSWSNILNAANVSFEKYIKIINNSSQLVIDNVPENVNELHIKGEGVTNEVALTTSIYTPGPISFENVNIAGNKIDIELFTRLISDDSIKMDNVDIYRPNNSRPIDLQSKNILLNNMNGDNVSITIGKFDNTIIIQNVNITNLDIIGNNDSNAVIIRIIDSKIDCLNIWNGMQNDVTLIDTEISKELHLNNIETLTFIGGGYNGKSEKFDICATNINLGVFNLNGVPLSKIQGTINQDSNLSSNRIYDGKQRSYGFSKNPTINPTIDSHLDAISESLHNTNSRIDESNEEIETLKPLLDVKSWLSKGVFTSGSEINPNDYNEGSILKCMKNDCEIEQQIVIPFKSIHSFNMNTKKMDLLFSLTDISHYCKPGDYADVAIIYNTPNEYGDRTYIEGDIIQDDSMDDDIVCIRCNIPECIEYLANIDTNDRNLELANSEVIITHNIVCNKGDRIVKLAHGWDKLHDIDGTIWTSENDGEGSNLNADLLDGLHAKDFVYTDSQIHTTLPTKTGIYSYRTSAISGKNETFTLIVRYVDPENYRYIAISDNNNDLFVFNKSDNKWESLTESEIIAPEGMLGSSLRLLKYEEQPLKFQTNDTDDGFIYLARIRNHNVYYKWVTDNSLITGITIHVKLTTDTISNSYNTYTYTYPSNITNDFKGFSIATCSIIETNDETYDRLLIAGCKGVGTNCELHLLDLDLEIANNRVGINTETVGNGYHTNIILSDGKTIYNAINSGSGYNSNITGFGDFYANESICYLTLRTGDASVSQSTRYNWGIFKVNIDRNSNDKWYTTYDGVHTLWCVLYTNFDNVYFQGYANGYRTPYEWYMYPHGDLQNLITIHDSSVPMGDEHAYLPESDTFYVVDNGSNPGERAQYFYNFLPNNDKSISKAIISLFDGHRFSYEPSPKFISTFSRDTEGYYLFVQNIGVQLNNVIIVNGAGKTIFADTISGVYNNIRYDKDKDVFCVDVGNGYEAIYKLI